MGIGLFRVILALTVIITHTHPVFGFTLGNPVIAVRTFFIISGFYMALILNEKYSHFFPFIKNRFLRIYPIYLVVLLLTVISCIGAYLLRGNWGELSPYAQYLSKMNIFSLMTLVVSQIIIFGRNIIMFSGLNIVTGFFTLNLHSGNSVNAWPFLLIPQAWTLPIELSFYLLAPFLVRKKLYVIGLVFILTLIVKSVLVGNGLTSMMWTYRFFPAELSYFILGIFSYKLYAMLKPTVVVKRIGFFASLLMIALLCVFNYGSEYLSLSIFTVEWIYYILIMLLLPFGFIYSKKLIFDRKIGELSYPIYISHVLVNNIANPLLIIRYAPGGNFSAIIVFLLSIIFSVIMLRFIQDPVERIRAKAV